MRRFLLRLAPLVLMLVVSISAVMAQNRAAKARRAAPPDFGPDVTDVFFQDASKKLNGERPNLATATIARGPANTPASAAGGAPVAVESGGAAASGGFAWSKLIAAETIEDEVKIIAKAVDETVTTPGPFKGGGYSAARNHFSSLASLFAIIAQYDGDVRWKREAPGLRDLFARSGFNCKVGTDQSYNEAKLRRDELLDLVLGQSIASAKEGEVSVSWDQVTNRPPLMVRFEEAFDKRINPWLSNKDAFTENAEKIYHEAQILAALSEVIQREGFEYWDDETYLEFAQQMRDGAVGIVDAVKTNNYEQARTSAGNISKSCSACHEGYRS